jgi:hypothetical protein
VGCYAPLGSCRQGQPISAGENDDQYLSFLCHLPVIFGSQHVILYLYMFNTSGCPPGWAKYSSHCYKLFTNRRSFSAADETCNNQSGFLASINTIAEYEFLGKLLK